MSRDRPSTPCRISPSRASLRSTRRDVRARCLTGASPAGSGCDRLIAAGDEVVAGIGQGLRQAEWKVASGVRADDLEIAARIALPASMAEFAVDQPRTQRRQRGEWFDRGAGRKGLFKSEARIDHGAQTAALRIDDDDRALALAERFFGDLLQRGVEFGLGGRGSRLR